MRVDGISKTKYKQMEYCMRPPFTLVWQLGYDTGLRISDILKLTPKKINRQRPYIKEQKTGKHRRLYIKKETLKAINDYIDKHNIPQDSPIFNFTRVTMWREIKRAASIAGIELNLGTHTMRKSYSKQYICKRGHTIKELSKRLNHSMINDTIGYITDNKELGIKGRTDI